MPSTRLKPGTVGEIDRNRSTKSEETVSYT
jgi:hypothetical protein